MTITLILSNCLLYNITMCLVTNVDIELILLMKKESYGGMIFHCKTGK